MMTFAQAVESIRDSVAILAGSAEETTHIRRAANCAQDAYLLARYNDPDEARLVLRDVVSHLDVAGYHGAAANVTAVARLDI